MFSRLTKRSVILKVHQLMYFVEENKQTLSRIFIETPLASFPVVYSYFDIISMTLRREMFF